MKMQNNEKTESQVAISYHEMKLLLHLIEFFFGQRGPMGNLQTTQAVAKTIGYSPQTDSKAPIAENNTYTTHWSWTSQFVPT